MKLCEICIGIERGGSLVYEKFEVLGICPEPIRHDCCSSCIPLGNLR